NLLVLGLILTAVAAMADGGGLGKPLAPASGERGWGEGESTTPSPPTPLPRVRGRGAFCCSLAAVCLALACLFKIYPIAIGLLLVVIYPGRFGWRLLLALVLGLGVPFLLQHPEYVATQYAGWLHHLQNDDRSGFPREYWYRDLRLLCDVCHC